MIKYVFNVEEYFPSFQKYTKQIFAQTVAHVLLYLTLE